MVPTNASAQTASTGTSNGPHFTIHGSNDSPPPQLRAVQPLIEEIISTSEHKIEAVQRFLQLATQLTNAHAVAYALEDTNGFRILKAGETNVFQSSEREELLRNWSAAASGSGVVQLNRIRGEPEVIATLPVFLSGGQVEVLHAALLVRRGQIEPFIVSLQLLATGITAWHARIAARRTEFEARTAAASVELIAKCSDEGTLAEAHFAIVTELQKLIGCSAVAIASRERQGRFRISAISGTSGIDQKSSLVCDLAECAVEAVSRGTLTVWPPLSMGDQHASRIHQHLVQSHTYEAVLSVPLQTQTETDDVLFLLGHPSILHADGTRNTVQALAPHLASTLGLKRQADAGPMARLKRRFRGATKQRRTRRGIFFAALLGTLAMLIPVPHKLTCNCVVEPTVKRFATVPFDGILEKSLVKPGDIVSADQVLARMDDRDLSFERSETTAARVQALKEADVHLTKGKIADAQIAQFRAAELQAKLKWIGYREDHLDIKSQIDGVVVEGDLEHAEGAPVRHGQVLFEVARLDSLKFKLEIPESDIAYVEQSMAVEARLDGVPGKRFDAKLLNVKPRASAANGENAFKADARLTEQDATLRPGMSGVAKIIAPHRPLGWIVFHRAYRKVVDFIDW